MYFVVFCQLRKTETRKLLREGKGREGKGRHNKTRDKIREDIDKKRKRKKGKGREETRSEIRLENM